MLQRWVRVPIQSSRHQYSTRRMVARSSCYTTSGNRPAQRRGVSGVLQVVATPIGNLDDVTFRAVDALRNADLVLAEDTRRTATLLRHIDATTPQQSLHEHNERDRTSEVLEKLIAGETIVLVSDAGTPTVSDPGYHLISACVAAGIRVEPIPGPSAMLAALVVAGLPTDRVAFDGFLPRKGQARQQRLQALATEPRTIVLYASVHRVGVDLDDLAAALGGDRSAVLARELTKRHEEVMYGTLDELRTRVREGVRGEVTLVIAGQPDQPPPMLDDHVLRDAIRAERAAGQSVRDAAAAVSTRTGVARRHVYELAIRDNE